MNWDDPAVRRHRPPTMWDLEVAQNPALRVPEWPPYFPMPADRIPAATLNPAYRYQDPMDFLPSLLFGLQFARG